MLENQCSHNCERENWFPELRVLEDRAEELLSCCYQSDFLLLTLFSRSCTLSTTYPPVQILGFVFISRQVAAKQRKWIRIVKSLVNVCTLTDWYGVSPVCVMCIRGGEKVIFQRENGMSSPYQNPQLYSFVGAGIVCFYSFLNFFHFLKIVSNF